MDGGVGQKKYGRWYMCKNVAAFQLSFKEIDLHVGLQIFLHDI